MVLERGLLSRIDANNKKIKELSERWGTETCITKDDTMELLAQMCDTSREIKSSKKPLLEETQVARYKIAKEQFNIGMLSTRNRHLYLDIQLALDKAYSVVKRYFYGE